MRERSPTSALRLSRQLLASLDGEPDADVEAAWAAEIERSVRRLDQAWRLRTTARAARTSIKLGIPPSSSGEGSLSGCSGSGAALT